MNTHLVLLIVFKDKLKKMVTFSVILVVLHPMLQFSADEITDETGLYKINKRMTKLVIFFIISSVASLLLSSLRQ